MDTFLKVMGVVLASIFGLCGYFMLAECSELVITTGTYYHTTETITNWPVIAASIVVIAIGVFTLTISFVTAYAYENSVKLLEIAKKQEKGLNKEAKEDEEPKAGEEKANI